MIYFCCKTSPLCTLWPWWPLQADVNASPSWKSFFIGLGEARLSTTTSISRVFFFSILTLLHLTEKELVKMSAAIKDNKEADREVSNNEVKNLLEIKSQQSIETCPHRKTPVSQDIGTLFYDGEFAPDDPKCNFTYLPKYVIVSTSIN